MIVGQGDPLRCCGDDVRDNEAHDLWGRRRGSGSWTLTPQLRNRGGRVWFVAMGRRLGVLSTVLQGAMRAGCGCEAAALGTVQPVLDPRWWERN